MQRVDLTQTHDVLGAYKNIDFKNIRERYKDPGTTYAFDVLDGKIIAPYKIQLACFRHLRDLQRQNTSDFPYHYDVNLLNKFLKFAAICPTGESVNKLVKLEPWQKFIYSQMLAWRDDQDYKRFTRVILSMARHNGKTYLMALLIVYEFLIGSIGKANQDYLVSSINYKQTTKLLGYVKKTLQHVLQVEPFKSYGEEVGLSSDSLTSQSDTIRMRQNNNRILGITYNAGSYDGFHFSLAIGDEFGQITDSQGVSDITTGQTRSSNDDHTDYQFVQISTAYPDPTTPFHKDEVTSMENMERDFDRTSGDNYLCLVWEQDNKDELFQEETWVKSNPLALMVPQMIDDLKKARSNALMTDTITKFENKSLNIWLEQSATSFLKLDDVVDAINNDFVIDGRDVYIGLDYSMFSDNTAIGFVYPYEVNGQARWHIEQHSFIPFNQAGSIEVKENQDGLAYRELEKRGFCTITGHPDGIINPEQVYRWLIEYVNKHRLHVIFFGYDRFGSYQVKNITESLIANTEWAVMDVAQRTSTLGNPTKFLQEIFYTHAVSRPDDPVLEKALLNAIVKEDKIGIQIDKNAASLKIDVVDAIIDALYQGMYHFEDFGMVNDRSKQVERMTQRQVLDWFNNPDSGLLGGGDFDD